MPRCSSCAGDVRDAAALRCPFCGASLTAAETHVAASVATAGGHPDHSSVHPPLFDLLDHAGFAPGRVFASRFRIVSRLGRGGMGDVYRAEDLRLGQPVALKLLSVEIARDREGLRRFEREVRLARGIAHPNVCRVFDIGEAEDWHYLSMEYVDGETLSSLRQRIGRLPPEKAVDVARQLCAGLAAAHELGVLHRDFKPPNIMLDGRGRVRILDFGLAMHTGDHVREIAGTPAYMAPEQLTGGPVTERTDLFALGLVLHELFTGQALFERPVSNDRSRLAADARMLMAADGIDSRVAEIVRLCLAVNPSERPASALHVAARLPGGDPIAAALAEGRVPPPDIVAAATNDRPLRPLVAWGLLAAMVAGLLTAAAGAELLTIGPSDVPRQPAVLADRAGQILAKTGDDTSVGDREFWFETIQSNSAAKAFRFVYRQSPEALVPQNLFHVVTPADPPMDAPGMADVVLDPSGRLVSFSRIVDQTRAVADRTASWAELFGDAGLAMESFVQTEEGRRPLVPHDAVLSWASRQPGSSPPLRLFGASFRGVPVYFKVFDGTTSEIARRGVLSTRRGPEGEAVLWFFVIISFIAMAIMARRNLRAGEGDLAGAWRLVLVVVAGGVMSGVLHAHHVAKPVDELGFLLSICGWTAVWGGFCWLAYVSFEPHVRRLWPVTLVSWTRVLAGRLRDALVGRDLLIGVLSGIAITMASMLRVMLGGRASTDVILGPVLESLRSTRHLTSAVIFAALDGLQFALGGFFMLLVLRRLFRRTWLAALVLIAINVAMAGLNLSLVDLGYYAGTTALFVVIVLRVGLLAGVTMLVSERLLTRLPLTLDFNAWYMGASTAVLLLVAGIAIWGFNRTMARRRPPVAVSTW
jgi:eukaryotic-like serine/threonine-protein kinase